VAIIAALGLLGLTVLTRRERYISVELKRRVQERTSELLQTNEALESQITERKAGRGGAARERGTVPSAYRKYS